MLLSRSYRRRRVKRVVALMACLSLFAGGVWVALRLAMPAEKGVRVVGAPLASSTEYRANGESEKIVVHQQVAPGKQQDIEIQGTDQGLLIRPSKK